MNKKSVNINGVRRYDYKEHISKNTVCIMYMITVVKRSTGHIEDKQ